jgi:deoxycytidine triphosphate deaminase
MRSLSPSSPRHGIVDGLTQRRAATGLGCLLIYSTVARIDPGFSGHITLEFANAATLPIKL